MNFSGEFSTNILLDEDLRVRFDYNRISLLNGCNSQSANYKAFSNGSLQINQFISTLKFCPNDNDRAYTNALTQSMSFVRNSENSLTFRNVKGENVITLTPFVNRPKDVVFSNTYKPNLNDDSDLLIRFDSSNKVNIINGCNSQSGTYKASDDGSISFGVFISTRMFCQNDKDSVYTNALTNSATFKLQGDQITLFSRSGQQTLLLTPFVAPPVVTPPVISPPVVISSPSRRISFLSGNYSTDIKNDVDLLVSFANDGKASILNGCNSFNTEYFAFSNGSVLFNEFVGTFKYCRNDNDYLYLNALGDSV